jgi:hypothetical protein
LPCRRQTVARKIRIASNASITVIESDGFGSAFVSVIDTSLYSARASVAARHPASRHTGCLLIKFGLPSALMPVNFRPIGRMSLDYAGHSA